MALAQANPVQRKYLSDFYQRVNTTNSKIEDKTISDILELIGFDSSELTYYSSLINFLNQNFCYNLSDLEYIVVYKLSLTKANYKLPFGPEVAELACGAICGRRALDAFPDRNDPSQTDLTGRAAYYAGCMSCCLDSCGSN